MRNRHLSFALLVCISSVLACKAFPQTPAPANTPGTPTPANSTTVQKSDLDSLEQNLKEEMQSATSDTEAQITKLESLVTNLDQSHLDIADAIDKLEDKTDWAPIIVSAIAVCISAFAVIFGTNRKIAMERKNTLTTLNADRLKVWIEDLQKTLAEFLNVRYSVDFFSDAAMRNNAPFPGKEHWDLVQNEDCLHNNLQIRLDPSRGPHTVLLRALAELRDHENRLEVIERRADVLNAARGVFEYEWGRITDDPRP